jgi:hypothetical protein
MLIEKLKGRPRLGWNNTKMKLGEIAFNCKQDPMSGFCEHNYELSSSTKAGHFLTS